MPHSKYGVSLITTLPSHNIGMECSALFITSDLPPVLTLIKRRILVSLGGLLVVLFGFFCHVPPNQGHFIPT